MRIKTKKLVAKEPEVVYRNNKAVSVILDIKEYKEMLERLEDIEDLEFIEKLKNRPLSFRKLDDFLAEYPASMHGR